MAGILLVDDDTPIGDALLLPVSAGQFQLFSNRGAA